MVLQDTFTKQGNWLFRYRGTLPLIIILVGLIVYSIEIYVERHYFIFTKNYFDQYLYFCLAVSLIGVFIRIYTVGHTPKNTSGRNVKNQVADTLNTTGIYSVVRHPLYLGNFFSWLGPVLFTGNIWFAVSVCFLFWIYYERIMYAEESFLLNKFGKTYLNWADKVPAFIPNFKLFVKPNTGFNWKKVLKNEKNGILALFMIFSIYDLLGNFLIQNNSFNYVIIFGFVFFILMYVLIKILKYMSIV